MQSCTDPVPLSTSQRCHKANHQIQQLQLVQLSPAVLGPDPEQSNVPKNPIIHRGDQACARTNPCRFFFTGHAIFVPRRDADGDVRSVYFLASETVASVMRLCRRVRAVIQSTATPRT